MSSKNESVSKNLSPLTPVSLNLQTRPFAKIEEDSVESEEKRASNPKHSTNILEKIVSSPIPESAMSMQRKPVNLLKAASLNQEIQAKLTIGEPNDKYEKEADDTASEVVRQISAPIPPDKFLQGKKLQMKSLLQRRENIGGGEASADLESSIQSARGGGRSLDANLQQSMGNAMGADFSGVNVHTDSQSDTLNKSIQAKAFTTGQDVFFRDGAYDPGSRGGQELIAHELTHVVQQNGNAVQRKKEMPDSPKNHKNPAYVEGSTKTESLIQRDGEELHQDVGPKFMFKLYEQAAAAKVEFDPIVSNIASMTQGVPKIPKLKDQNTAVAKSEGEYGGDHSRLVDICRASIIYNSYKDLMEGLGKSKEMMNLVREKNRFAVPTAAGYRDILLNVKLSNGHIAELQLHLQQIMDVKNGVGHELYEEVRLIERAAKEAARALTPEEAVKVEQILAESRIHYDAAFEKSQNSDEATST